MSDTTTAAEGRTVTRPNVAKHEFLAEPGGPGTTIESAIGIRYTDIKTGLVREFFPRGAKAGTELTMTSLFGSKTKATNEASRIRNGEGGDATAQMEAIDEMFDSLLADPPVWREKAEGGGGSRTDKGLLAKILVEVLGTNAKGTAVEYEHRLETEEGYLRKVLKSAAGDEYRKQVGKTGPAIESLA